MVNKHLLPVVGEGRYVDAKNYTFLARLEVGFGWQGKVLVKVEALTHTSFKT